RPRPAVDGRAADAEPARRDDAWHDGLERARARDRALRAACGRGPRDDRHHCRALLRGPCAREPVLWPNRRSLRSQIAAPSGAPLDAGSLFLYSLATTPLLLALVRVSHGLGSGLVVPSS